MSNLINYSSLQLTDLSNFKGEICVKDFEENIRIVKQAGSDVVIIFKIKISKITENKVVIISSDDETLEYAPFIDKSLKNLIQQFEEENIKINGFKVEISEGIVHPVDFVPFRIQGNLNRWFKVFLDKRLKNK